MNRWFYPVGLNFPLDKSRRMTYISTMVSEKAVTERSMHYPLPERAAVPPCRIGMLKGCFRERVQKVAPEPGD